MNTLKKRSRVSAAIRAAMFATATITALNAPLSYAEESTEDEAEENVKITITGSRIQRTGVDTVYPAVVVDRQELEDRGFTNVADALNEISTFGNPDATPQGGQLGSSVGQNFVDFIGLGAQRTLTLVNGRRFVSQNTPSVFGETGGLQIDFNVIPIAMVERIETIGVGGAPTYGSDAISGTINVILKDDFEGLDFTMQTGQTSESDAKSDLFSFVAGANFSNGKGNVVISGEHYSQEGLLRNARPRYTANDPEFLEENDGVNRIFRNRRINIFTNGGLASPGGTIIPSFGSGAFPDGNFYQFDSGSNLVPFTAGQVSPGSAFFALGGDGPDFFDNVAQIQSPLERQVFTGRVTFDFTDNVSFSSDILFANSSAKELVNQGGFQTFAFGGTSGALRFSSDNPFLPQGTQQLLADNGLTEFSVHRFNNDILDSSDFREQFVWRYTAGLEGDFLAFDDRNFQWDVSFVHGRSDGEESSFGIVDDRFLNAIDARRITQADVQELSDAGLTTDDLLRLSGTSSANVGDIICESVYQATLGNITGTSGNGVTDADLPFIEGCAPLNLFGQNAASAEAIAFITGNQMSQTDIEQSVYTVNFGGEIAELPGGWASFNLGYEKRQEKAFFEPGLGNTLSITRSSAFNPTGGRYSTDEWYGELSLPIISAANDIFLVENLELTWAQREIDNSLAGDATVWSAGFIYAPVADVSFRGNYTESLRAPSLVELFAPLTRSFSSANDPCDFRFVGDGPDAATRLANCQSDIASYDPATFTSNIVNATAVGQTGGNDQLRNETSESWAIGATIEPRWVEDLLVTVDLINIELEDAIQSLGLTALTQACYDSSDFPNAPSCGSFTRDASGQIVDFTTGQTNAALFSVKQADLTARYKFDMTDIGQFGIFARWTHLVDRNVSVNGEPNSPTRGGFTDPKNSGNVDLTWENDDWRVFWRVLWTEAAELSASGDNVFENLDGDRIYETDAVLLNNMSVAYFVPKLFEGAPEDTTIRFTINNVFDHEPDLIQEAAGHFGFSELLGRSYNLTLNMRF